MRSPTRRALLTWRNHTRVGNGQIAAIANAFDGFSGVIYQQLEGILRIPPHR